MEKKYSEDDHLLMGNFILSLKTNEHELDEKFLKIAADELREDENIRKNAEEELKSLIANFTDFNSPLENNDIDINLLSFLRVCKFYTDSAFERLKKFHQYRLEFPEYFSNISPFTARSGFQNNLLTILPNRDQNGRRMMIINMGKRWKPSSCSLTEVVRSCILTLYAAVQEPKTQIAGIVLILDLEGFSIRHVWQFSPSIAKMCVGWIQEAMPLRLKAIHVVKQPVIFNLAFAIFKPFLNKKLSERLHFHRYNTDSLLDYINAEHIPLSFGGSMDISMDTSEEQWKYLERNKDRFIKPPLSEFDEEKNLN